ncbi:MAG TPA: hypothetical protein PLW11_09915 [Bacillota bacterium]|nr:hypothetical protein [Bacillota bacterium]
MSIESLFYQFCKVDADTDKCCDQAFMNQLYIWEYDSREYGIRIEIFPCN